MSDARPLPGPRIIGRVNWVGFWTLYQREVQRFLSVHLQTVTAPVITSLLFLSVFLLALGRAVETVNGIPFAIFLSPGLIMMVMVQNAFANTSSSMVISKIQGNIVDVLMPPLSPFEFVAAFTLGGVTRGVMVGIATYIGMRLFLDIPIHNFFMIACMGILASLMLSLMGLVGGIWADKFDHIAAVTNFFITPLSFLSGTFYSIENLPEFGVTLAHLNPFFYMIDGFRYGFIGQSDSNPAIGISVLLVINIALWVLCHQLVKRGYKLKT